MQRADSKPRSPDITDRATPQQNGVVGQGPASFVGQAAGDRGRVGQCLPPLADKFGGRVGQGAARCDQSAAEPHHRAGAPAHGTFEREDGAVADIGRIGRRAAFIERIRSVDLRNVPGLGAALGLFSEYHESL